MDIYDVNESEIVVSCLPGLNEVLIKELSGLGYKIDRKSPKSVTIKGSFNDTYFLNYWLRTASHVYFKVAEFSANNPDQLYSQANKVEWEYWMDSSQYFSVTSFVKNDSIRDTRFPNMKLKDAIVDRYMKREGKRPNSGPEKDRVVVHLQWIESQVGIYLDTSGITLSKRGYRMIPGDAPLSETLAAGLILSSGWDGKTPFVNPMCGSGTLGIEAALIAYNIPPAFQRFNFAFKHLKPFDRREWQKLVSVLPKISIIKPEIPIVLSDIRRKAVAETRKNIERAKVSHLIELKVCDFERTTIPTKPGMIILNPPYGMRLGEEKELESLYERVGDFFKAKCVNYKACIFTGNMELAKRVGLRTASKQIFWNAKIESRLLVYVIYTGSKKTEVT